MFGNPLVDMAMTYVLRKTLEEKNSTEVVTENSSTPPKSKKTLPEIPLVHKKEYYGDNVAEVTTIIRNPSGMCARPCSHFVSIANKFKSNVRFSAKGKTVDGKSVLMLMSINPTRGTEVTISANGSDAGEAVRELVDLIDHKLEGW